MNPDVVRGRLRLDLQRRVRLPPDARLVSTADSKLLRSLASRQRGRTKHTSAEPRGQYPPNRRGSGVRPQLLAASARPWLPRASAAPPRVMPSRHQSPGSASSAFAKVVESEAGSVVKLNFPPFAALDRRHADPQPTACGPASLAGSPNDGRLHWRSVFFHHAQHQRERSAVAALAGSDIPPDQMMAEHEGSTEFSSPPCGASRKR